MNADEDMLKLMYITNDPDTAVIAQNAGVNRIFVDMEYIGKEQRQMGLNTVKNHHTLADVKALRNVLTGAQLLVRVNPLHNGSEKEIKSVVEAGADIIMLPMWKTAQEVERFARLAGDCVKKMLLLETKEAASCLESVLELGCVDEIHIGLNDLRISMGKSFIFESLADGTVDKITSNIRDHGIPFGFGGFGMPGEGLLPADLIMGEHYRLGSSMAILSRSFCDKDSFRDPDAVRARFDLGMKKIRDYECFLSAQNEDFFRKNHNAVQNRVKEILNGDAHV